MTSLAAFRLPATARIAVAAAALVLAGNAAAAPGGPIGTLPLGHYICELPGDATGPSGLRQTAEEFTIVFGSSYRAAQGTGTYLLTGDRVAFTAGPMKNAMFRRVGPGFLRRTLPGGGDGPLRCVRRGSGAVG